jgi:predicted nucleic acid-binding protein
LLVYRVGCQITLVTNSRRYVQGQCKARCGVFFPRGDPLASDCRQSTHATNLPLDDNLIEEARRAGHHKTKKEAVKAALAEYGLRRKRLGILNVFGSVDFDPKYDTKRSAAESAPDHAGTGDTPIWSLALGRKDANLSSRELSLTRAWRELIQDGRAELVGPVLQELLSGVREEASFKRLRDQLRAFEQASLDFADDEEAARLNNQGRAPGIAGSAIDFLICAAALRRGWQGFTTDHDLIRYSTVFPLRLYKVSSSRSWLTQFNTRII